MKELVQYLIEELVKKEQKKTFRTTQKSPSICRKRNKATWEKKEDKVKELKYDIEENNVDPPGFVEPGPGDIEVPL